MLYVTININFTLMLPFFKVQVHFTTNCVVILSSYGKYVMKIMFCTIFSFVHELFGTVLTNTLLMFQLH